MPNHYPNLNQQKALIWRIVHRDNLPWIFDNGLYCGNSGIRAPNWVDIGNTELITKRNYRSVPIFPGGSLNDYVPFYFTPFSPMMYNIHTGRGGVSHRHNEEIVILVSSLYKIQQDNHQFVFTDRHAYPVNTCYFNQLTELSHIDWPLLQTRNFQRNPDDPEQIERYQAEALIYQHLPITGLIGIVCYTDALKLQIEAQLKQRGLHLDVRQRQGWYF